ncbi:DUF3181 family protein [Synechococcus elongatus IITB4]|uniref:DUF3181 family protein n=1 Tax=Synechococcus elongatus TaxID=32046 RepID=UPI0030D40DD4
MSYAISTELLEQLAAEIGDQIYLDIAQWHLYLDDAKLSRRLAELLITPLEQGQIDEHSVTTILNQFPVKVGGGRRQMALLDLIPMSCVTALIEILEEFQKRL